MNIVRSDTLNIILVNDEIDTFQDILDKCSEEESKVGFKHNLFSDEEVGLLATINFSINGKQT